MLFVTAHIHTFEFLSHIWHSRRTIGCHGPSQTRRICGNETHKELHHGICAPYSYSFVDDVVACHNCWSIHYNSKSEVSSSPCYKYFLDVLWNGCTIMCCLQACLLVNIEMHQLKGSCEDETLDVPSALVIHSTV